MDATTPGEVNASGDFIRGLKFTPKGGEAVPAKGGGDRLEMFFHTLKGLEGTIRNWRSRSQADKLTFLNAYERPRPDKNTLPAEALENEKLWRTTMLGILFMELSEPGYDVLVAQAAFDALRPEKVGKR